MNKRDCLVDVLTQRYKRLGSYRAVVDTLNNEISPAMVRLIIQNGVWSPKAARVIGIENKRYRLCAEFDTIEERERFRREVLRGRSMTEYCKGLLIDGDYFTSR